MWWRMIPKTYEAFFNTREVPRDVAPPLLSPKDIRTITRIVFEPVSIAAADVLFLFGSEKTDYDFVVHVYHAGYAPYIIANGLPGSRYYKTGVSLADEARHELIARGVPRTAVLAQRHSLNTLEDVVFGKHVLEKNGVYPKRILFVCKAHHSGRARRTLAKHFPDATLYAGTYTGTTHQKPIIAGTWPLDEHTRARVYAELLRIQRYTQRGDIAP